MCHTRRSRNLYNSGFHNQILETTQCHCVDKFASLILLILKLMLTKSYCYEEKIKHTLGENISQRIIWCSSLTQQEWHLWEGWLCWSKHGIVGGSLLLWGCLWGLMYVQVTLIISGHFLLPVGSRCSPFLHSAPSPLPCLLRATIPRW